MTNSNIIPVTRIGNKLNKQIEAYKRRAGATTSDLVRKGMDFMTRKNQGCGKYKVIVDDPHGNPIFNLEEIFNNITDALKYADSITYDDYDTDRNPVSQMSSEDCITITILVESDEVGETYLETDRPIVYNKMIYRLVD